MSVRASAADPKDRRALIAVDLGAESCRVSLLRWHEDTPKIQLVHRFGNGPVQLATGLYWPLKRIIEGVEDGLRMCAGLAREGVRSIAVDGWAVDYVRLDERNQALAEPFCYRDERNERAEPELHKLISPSRMREITGIQLVPLNTLYQLFADRLADTPQSAWLNLPEYLLARWGAEHVAEYTNATHHPARRYLRPELEPRDLRRRRPRHRTGPTHCAARNSAG